MVFNVMRNQGWLHNEDRFILGKRTVAVLQYALWPPMRVLDVEGEARYGIRWSTSAMDVQCWIIELCRRNTVARLQASRTNDNSTIEITTAPVEGGLLELFNNSLQVSQVRPDRWHIWPRGFPQRVSVRLCEDAELKAQIATCLPMTASDLALAWLWVTRLALGMPEFWLPGP